MVSNRYISVSFNYFQNSQRLFVLCWQNQSQYKMQKVIEDKQNKESLTKSVKFDERQRRSLITKNNNYIKGYSSSKQREQKEKKIVELKSHPAGKYIMGNTLPLLQQFKRFATLLYQGLYYSICSIKGPSQEFLKKKSVRLPQSKNAGLKFLMLDLDETLIHSIFDKEKSDVCLQDTNGEIIKFNIRPYCLQFLSKMSEFYQIYIFTASTEDYAQPIVNYLNLKKKTIYGILSRSNCLQTTNGLKIKDLRVIKNRGLQDIIIVDNLVHSFGLQLDNGIPILQFTNNSNDRQLVGLEKLLMEMKDVLDVRKFLQKKLALRKCIEIDQDQFMTVKVNIRVTTVKKRQTLIY